MNFPTIVIRFIKDEEFKENELIQYRLNLARQASKPPE
jgi:hypothetical protein